MSNMSDMLHYYTSVQMMRFNRLNQNVNYDESHDIPLNITFKITI